MIIGNEPFLNTLPEDIAPPDGMLPSNFTRFYESITNDALRAWPENIPFYFGSFESLWIADPDYAPGEAAARAELLAFVNRHPRINGVDLHLHSRNLDQIDKAFAWLDDPSHKLADDKTIIITEFSPTLAFKDDMDEKLEEPFRLNHRIPSGIVQNKDYLNYAIQEPRDHTEFGDWLVTLSFPHYVCDAWQKFTSHGRFRLAFQGATQGPRPPADMLPHYDGGDPWILNPILMPVTQKPLNNQPTVHRYWFLEVQKILRNEPCQ